MNEILIILGVMLFLANIGALITLVRRGIKNKESEAKNEPGEEPSEEVIGNAKVINVKDIPVTDNDYSFCERPYNPYELYN